MASSARAKFDSTTSSPFSAAARSEEHTSELPSRRDLVCRLLLEKKKTPGAAAHLQHEDDGLAPRPGPLVRVALAAGELTPISVADGAASTEVLLLCFFFNDTATTEIYTLSLHDALPISTAPRLAGLSYEYLRAAMHSFAV